MINTVRIKTERFFTALDPTGGADWRLRTVSRRTAAKKAGSGQCGIGRGGTTVFQSRVFQSACECAFVPGSTWPTSSTCSRTMSAFRPARSGLGGASRARRHGGHCPVRGDEGPAARAVLRDAVENGMGGEFRAVAIVHEALCGLGGCHEKNEQDARLPLHQDSPFRPSRPGCGGTRNAPCSLSGWFPAIVERLTASRAPKEVS